MTRIIKKSFSAKKSNTGKRFYRKTFSSKRSVYKMAGKAIYQMALYGLWPQGNSWMDGRYYLCLLFRPFMNILLFLKTKELITKMDAKENWRSKQMRGKDFCKSFIVASVSFIQRAWYIFFFLQGRRWRTFPKRSFNLVPFREKIYYWKTTRSYKSWKP